MIRLFSSFDLFYFSNNFLSLLWIITILFSPIYINSSMYNFLIAAFKNLSEFFFSLKSKSFNKFSNLLFISIFFFLVTINFFSVFSYNFPLTSQVRVVLIFSLGAWLIIVAFGIFTSINTFLYHFVPEGTPLPLTFVLFLIELVRNLIRPLTLIVRLVANILAGHLLIILLSQLVFIFPLGFPLYILLNLVEIFVSLIQSYIFSTILVLYFSEV